MPPMASLGLKLKMTVMQRFLFCSKGTEVNLLKEYFEGTSFMTPWGVGGLLYCVEGAEA